MNAVFSTIPLDFIPLALAILTGSLLLTRSWVLAVRRDRKRQRRRTRHSGGIGAPAAAVRRTGVVQPLDVEGESLLMDIEVEARGALRRLDGMAAQNGVRFEVAIQSGLIVHTPPIGFRHMLDDVLGRAIAQAPGGKVMIGGMRHGGRIQVAILDDGIGQDRESQEVGLRNTMQFVALQGGTLEVNARAGEGTLVVMRLPEPQNSAKPRAARTNDSASATGATATDIRSPQSAALTEAPAV